MPVRLRALCRGDTAPPSRRCVAHVGTTTFLSGWEGHGTVHGLATCTDVNQETWDKAAAHRAPLAVLVTVGSFALVDEKVAARIGRAHVQTPPPNFFRVLQISREGGGGEYVGEDSAARAALERTLGATGFQQRVVQLGIVSCFPLRYQHHVP